MKIWTKKVGRRVCLAALGLAVLLGVVAAVFPGEILTVDTGKAQADVIVVLGGGSAERPVRAAQLFHEHAAPKIILTGYGDCESNRRLLLEKGVPADAIVLEPKARSTRENARLTVALLRQSAGAATGAVAAGSAAGESVGGSASTNLLSGLSTNAAGPACAILVTSWYHSRRTLQTFRKEAPDIRFYSRPSYFGYPGSADAVNAKGLRWYAWAEYVKLLGYWVVYGVRPG